MSKPYLNWFLVNQFMLIFAFLGIAAGPLQARGSMECLGVNLAEIFVPGAGYLYLRQWDKAASLGAMRWVTWAGYGQQSKQDDFEEDQSDIIKQKLDEDPPHIDFYLSRSTFYGQAFGSVYQSLTFTTLYDLNASQCEPNPNTFGYFLAPLRFDQFGTSWKFWTPLIVIGTALSGSEVEINYYTDKNLKRDEMLATSFVEYQLVGIGEELLFRGLLQTTFYDWYRSKTDYNTARWGGIVTSAALFGLAHSGQGLSATPGPAFLSGLYLGWVYHPYQEDFDLTQAIAIHSWWDTIYGLSLISKGHFSKQNKSLKTRHVASQRTIPLWQMAFRF